MTIFDILNINPPEYPVTFLHGRFYAYKDILIDLHSESPITLQPITTNNNLFQQLNINESDCNLKQYTWLYNGKYDHYTELIIHTQTQTIHYYQGNNHYIVKHTDIKLQHKILKENQYQLYPDKKPTEIN